MLVPSEIMLLFLTAHITFVCVVCENIIDVDDILSSDFMPGSLLMLETPDGYENVYENSSVDEASLLSKSDGGVDAALTTMGYHR